MQGACAIREILGSRGHASLLPAIIPISLPVPMAKPLLETFERLRASRIRLHPPE